MLVGFFFNITILYSIYGYSYVYKKYILDDNDSLKNIDFFFGLFFIYLLSLIFNFFSGISIFVWPIHFIGLIFFIFCYFKKKIEIKFFILSAIIFIFTFLAYTNSNNVDSPMYHLQILKWLEHEKIIFGLANLEIRFAMNSSWHNIISLLNLNFYSFASKFYLTPILLGVMINELFTLKKNNKNSYYFLLLSTLTLLFYNLLHPFHNGIIFNHLGNPEFDIATLVFFICFLYVVFVFEEVKNKKNYLQLLFILIFFSITSRLTNIPIILVGLFYLFNYKSINNKFNLIFIAVCSFFWFLRNFILSGCILFPIKETCLNTSWTVNLADVTKHKNEVLSWTRGYSSGNHDNYDFTINSYDWIYPWFQSYFFKDALLQIFSILIIFPL